MATAKKTPAKKAAPVKAPATKAPAKKAAPTKVAAPAKKVAPVAKTAVAKAPAKKAVPVKAPASAVKKAVAKAPAAKKVSANAAFMKALTPSAALAAVVGDKPMPRTEVVSKLWIYIKANKLQDSKNKRQINADTKLKAVFGKPTVTMFEMAGLIGKHLS